MQEDGLGGLRIPFQGRAAFRGYCARRGNISKTARSIKFNVNAVNVINASG